ncbi:MAG: type II toxin-antitoxin system VapC family toxin [Phycisphaerales bacterium]|nr:type II toxin-antitoxin system VapC family toxin [Phycisphaerales bacterium]
MIYLLDTSACIDYLRHTDSPLRKWAATGTFYSFRLCSVVRAELLLGIWKHDTPRKRQKVMAFLALFESYPFDDDAAAVYAKYAQASSEQVASSAPTTCSSPPSPSHAEQPWSPEIRKSSLGLHRCHTSRWKS